MRRGRSAAFLLACALAAILVAQPGLAATRDEPEPLIPEGVSISGIAVGGLTPDAANSVIQTAFEAPLTLWIAESVLMPTPLELGATAYVPPAVARAMVAPPNTDVPLTVRVAGAKVRAYVALLAKRFDRKPVDARVLLRKVRPFVTEERPGQSVERLKATATIVRALTSHSRLPMAVPVEILRPSVTRKNIGPVLVIRRESKWLHLYNGATFVKRFRIATGMSQYPTPLGRFTVVSMWRNPWWYPPDSDWAKDEQPVPPGPGNPLGTRWMGISAPGVGIHGTPDAASLGYSLSHGCVRMAIPEAEWLFKRVRIGTTVFIVSV